MFGGDCNKKPIARQYTNPAGFTQTRAVYMPNISNAGNRYALYDYNE